MEIVRWAAGTSLLIILIIVVFILFLPLWALGLLIIAAIALFLILPVYVRFEISRELSFRFNLSIKLLMTEIEVSLPKKKEPTKKKKKKKWKKGIKPEHFFIFLEAGQSIPRLITDLLHSIDIDEIKGHLRIGLKENPHDVWMLYAYSYPMEYILDQDKVNISLEQDFESDRLLGSGHAAVKITPYLVGFAFLRFLSKRHSWRLINEIRKA